jgi:E3 ubiquitin-protein ligase TRIP12
MLSKVPLLYKPAFRREGVFHEIELMSERALTISKAKEKEGSESTEEVPPPPSISGFKKLSSMSLDSEDAITLRARVIQFKYLAEKENPEKDDAFQTLCSLVEKISAPQASDKDYSEALWELADLFASPHTSVSSFELLQSGVVDSLLRFATDENRAGMHQFHISKSLTESILVDLQRRKELLLDAFAARNIKNLNTNKTPFATLVKKLQESLTRMESFDVITVTSHSDGKLIASNMCMHLSRFTQNPKGVRHLYSLGNSASVLSPVTILTFQGIFKTLLFPFMLLPLSKPFMIIFDLGLQDF